MTTLRGQTAIVAGGDEPAGLAIAAALARAGAHVTLSAPNRDSAEAAAALLVDEGLTATGTELDLSEPEASALLVQQVVASNGRLDVWVNCAIGVSSSLATSITEHRWQTSVAQGLSGAFFASRAAGKQMLEQRAGVIVNIIEPEAEHPIEGSSLTSAIAGGVAALTRALAVEWASAGVRVVGLAPAPLWAARSMRPTEQDRDKRVPIRRSATPNEIGQAAVFLASDEASFITGAILPVDGGWRAYQLF